MIKNFTLFLFIAILSFSTDLVKGQCVPDSTISGLYSPDVTVGLPDGVITIMYEAVITMKIPSDTGFAQLSATVDSCVLTNVTGLPPTFSYECSSAGCSFPGGDIGCIRVFGVSNDNADAKTWDIQADFLFYLSNPSLTMPYSLSEYSITLDSIALGVKEVRKEDYRFLIEPNPITESSKLTFDLPESGRYVLDIYSLIGSNVAHFESVSSRATTIHDLSDFAKEPGVYFVSLKQGNYSRSMRFIVQ